MTVRPIEKWDIVKIKEIHEKHFKQEFSFPDFTKHYLATFLVETDDKQIICASGIRTILESVLVTNKDLSVRVRKEALFNVLQGSLYVAERAGYNELHAYVQGDNWTRALRNVGFHPTKGQSLVAMW